MAKSPSPPARKKILALAAATALAVAGAVAPAQESAAAALITTPVSLAGAHWIWFNEGDPTQSVPAATRYLRRTFTAPAGPYTDAQLVVTGDDTVDVWLNGKPVGGLVRGRVLAVLVTVLVFSPLRGLRDLPARPPDRSARP
jgi:alpha-L-rhamnosidase